MNVVKPLLAVAVKVMAAAPKETGEAGVKVTVWLALLIVSEYACAPLKLLASVAVTVTLKFPPALGVPLKNPELDSVKPVGKLPPVSAKLYAATPPLAVIVWL